MTSTPIQEMTAMFANMASQGQTPKSSDANTDSFGDILGNLSNGSADVSAKYDQISQDSKNDISNGITKADETEKSNNTSTNVSKNDSSKNSEVNDVTKETNIEENKISDEEVKEIEDAILEKVSKELGISVEEIEDVLETLGISAIDLINPDNVSMLVTAVKADGDMLSLITNEDVLNAVTNINEDVNAVLKEVSSELGISVEELSAKIEEAVSNNSESLISSNETDSLEITNDKQLNDTKPVETDNVSNNSNDSDAVVINSSENTVNTNSENTDTSSDSNQFNANTSNSDSKILESKISESKADENPFKEIAQSINAENAAPVEAEVIPEDTLGRLFEDQNEIIDQVNEYIKTNFKAETSSVEMQLNPENLGTVNVSIAAKEGNVTAQFTTQNEAVRAALESQIIQLKENLENQGVKVTAVDVTVASHEFERNLDKNDGGQEAKEQEENRLRKATRKLNLNDILADNNYENLDEDQVVTAKMMEADGSKMDYKV